MSQQIHVRRTADDECAAGKQRGRFHANPLDHSETDVLGRVPWSCKDAQLRIAEQERVAFVQSQVIEGQVRFRARANRDAELHAEFACARNEIGVQVRVECVR